jgi:hypothetical protein
MSRWTFGPDMGRLHWFWRAVIAAAAAEGAVLLFNRVFYPDARSTPGDYFFPIILMIFMAWGQRHTRCRKCRKILRDVKEPRCPECGERI